MSTTEELKHEIESLKKRVSLLEKKSGHVEEKEVIKEPQKENTPVAGIVLTIIGAILTVTVIGAIIGLPLLIVGIVILVKNSKEKKEKHEKKEVTGFEANVVLKWFSIVGILALVVGIGFFIKYAIDNNWIDHLTRIVLGVVLGLALIVFGLIYSKKEKYEFFTHILIGGGLAISYFAVYAAYHFEEYKKAIGISLSFEILFLTLIAVIALIISLIKNSQIIIGEAFFLGYVTSLLSSSFEILTLVYTLILTVALVFVVCYKKWGIISIAGILATYLVYIFWYFNNSDSFFTSLTFLITYFVSFTIQTFFQSKSHKHLNVLNVANTLLNSLFFFILTYVLLKKNYPDYDGIISLILIAVYLLGYLIFKIRNEKEMWITNQYLTAFYITMTILLLVNKELITIIWIFEAALLTLLSLKLKNNHIKYSSYAVALFCMIKLLCYDSWALREFEWANIIDSTRFLSFIFAILIFYALYAYLKLNIKHLSTHEKIVPTIYLYAGTFFSAVLILLEIKDIWMSVAWAVLALVINIIGFRYKNRHLRIQGIVIFAITVLKVFLYDTRELDTLYRTISFVTLGAILLLVSFIYAKYKDKLKEIL